MVDDEAGDLSDDSESGGAIAVSQPDNLEGLCQPGVPHSKETLGAVWSPPAVSFILIIVIVTTIAMRTTLPPVTRRLCVIVTTIAMRTNLAPSDQEVVGQYHQVGTFRLTQGRLGVEGEGEKVKEQGEKLK